MDEQMIGPRPGEVAAPDASRLAERLIRQEFGAPDSASDETAPVPAVTGSDAGAHDVRTAGGAIHEEFAETVPLSGSRSHRTGMLAGLGVVGLLLAVLVVLSPGSGQPRLPVQSVHDVSPFVANGPQTATATVLPASEVPPSTTSTVAVSNPTTPTTPATPVHRSATVPTTVTYVYQPGSTTPVSTQTTAAPAATPTTAPPPAPPPTTTTTAPPPTTTTTTTTHCILCLVC